MHNLVIQIQQLFFLKPLEVEIDSSYVNITNVNLWRYNKLIAEKYDGSCNKSKVGRPPITLDIVNLVIKFKKENPRWGYQKITDQIEYLGYKISKTSVKNILIENGYDPESDLTVRSTWHEFLKSHWDVMAARRDSNPQPSDRQSDIAVCKLLLIKG